MKAIIKMTGAMMAQMHADLRRPHGHAHERVGFVTAGCSWRPDGSLVVLAREYLPVADEDYIRNARVGAMVGPDAMRKGLQRAYGTRSALLHVHTHGGLGVPEFSSVDIEGGKQFVPSFFSVVPYMPHGLMVLSNDSAKCLLWTSEAKRPVRVDHFVSVGAQVARFGEAA